MKLFKKHFGLALIALALVVCTPWSVSAETADEKDHAARQAAQAAAGGATAGTNVPESLLADNRLTNATEAFDVVFSAVPKEEDKKAILTNILSDPPSGVERLIATFPAERIAELAKQNGMEPAEFKKLLQENINFLFTSADGLRGPDIQALFSDPSKKLTEVVKARLDQASKVAGNSPGKPDSTGKPADPNAKPGDPKGKPADPSLAKGKEGEKEAEAKKLTPGEQKLVDLQTQKLQKEIADQRKAEQLAKQQALQQAAGGGAGAGAGAGGGGSGGGGSGGGGGGGGGGSGGGGRGAAGNDSGGSNSKPKSLAETHRELNPNKDQKNPNLRDVRNQLQELGNNKQEDKTKKESKAEKLFDDIKKESEEPKKTEDLFGKKKAEADAAQDPSAGQEIPTSVQSSLKNPVLTGPTSVPGTIGYYGGDGGAGGAAFSGGGGGGGGGGGDGLGGGMIKGGAGGGGAGAGGGGGDSMGSVGKLDAPEIDAPLKRIAVEFGTGIGGDSGDSDSSDNSSSTPSRPRKGASIGSEIVFIGNQDAANAAGPGVFATSQRLRRWCRNGDGLRIGVCPVAKVEQRIDSTKPVALGIPRGPQSLAEKVSPKRAMTKQ